MKKKHIYLAYDKDFDDAMIDGNVDKIKQSLHKGMPVDSVFDGASLLFMAIFEKQPGIVKLLLENGADIEQEGIDGITPLLDSIGRGDIETVQLLLKHGADLEHVDEDGFSPMVEAISSCAKIDILVLLLESGADINAMVDGKPTLVYAVYEKKLDAVELLVEKGADVNASGSDGWTPLMEAVDGDSPALVQLLLDLGADQALQNNDGETALDYAQRTNSDAMIEVLQTGRVCH